MAPAACYAAAAMWCVTAFGYVSNDYFDIHEDSINKPDRPLPNGAVPTSSAAGLAIGLGLGAILFSLPLGDRPPSPRSVAMALLGISLIIYGQRQPRAAAFVDCALSWRNLAGGQCRRAWCS